jgi:hypothetical protein
MNIFRWKDFLTFALPSLLFTIGALVSTLNGKNSYVPMLVCLWVVAAVGWGLYGFMLFKRWRRASGVTFRTKHGMAVITGGRPVTALQVEKEVDRTFTMWGLRSGLRLPNAHDVHGLVVIFKDYPFESHGAELAGLQKDNIVVVGWKPLLEQTALGHEVGHYLYKNVFKLKGDFHVFEAERNLG